MKTFLFTLLMLISMVGFGQITGTTADGKGPLPFIFQSDCGYWVEDSLIYSEWKTTKIILQNNGIIKNDWVYDEIRSIETNGTLSVYYPCGCGHEKVMYQDRVCKNTGVLQRRDVIQKYKYIPKPKNNFQKTLDSLSKKQ
jgi:hypothetical protein